MNRYADIVEMAESGDREARIEGRNGVWRRQWTDPKPDALSDWEQRWFAEHGGYPKPVEVLVPPNGGMCYAVSDLLHDDKMREAVKRTAEWERSRA